jgi:hypothetical protein
MPAGDGIIAGTGTPRGAILVKKQNRGAVRIARVFLF